MDVTFADYQFEAEAAESPPEHSPGTQTSDVEPGKEEREPPNS